MLVFKFFLFCLVIYNVNSAPPLFGAMSSIAHSITDSVKKPVDTVIEIPASIIDMIAPPSNKDSSNPASIIDTVSQLPNSMLQHVQDIPNTVMGIAGTVPQTILGAAGQIVPSNLANAGGDVPDQVSDVTNKIVPTDLVDNVKNQLPLENVHDTIKPDQLTAPISNIAQNLNPGQVTDGLGKNPTEIVGDLTKKPTGIVEQLTKNVGGAPENPDINAKENPQLDANIPSKNEVEKINENAPVNEQAAAAAPEQKETPSDNAIERKTRNADYHPVDSWENEIINFDLFAPSYVFPTDSIDGNHHPSYGPEEEKTTEPVNEFKILKIAKL